MAAQYRPAALPHLILPYQAHIRGAHIAHQGAPLKNDMYLVARGLRRFMVGSEQMGSPMNIK
jgi:hypothetical protein